METLNEKLDKYRQAIQQILARLAAIPLIGTDAQDRVLFDRERDSYALIAEGWDGEKRVHHFVVHLEIINGKVWIQVDNTDVVIARELEAYGIPKSDIVLGFRAPSVRPLTDYAVA